MAPSDSDRRIQSAALSRAELDVGNPVKQSTLPIPQTSTEVDPRRRSTYDDGVRPLNILFKQSPPSNSNLAPERLIPHSSSTDTLTVTSRRDKRRSINPGLTLSPFPDTIPSSTLSPPSESFNDQQTIVHSPTSPRLNTFDITSRKESIDLSRHDRPNSHSSSIHSSRSLSTSNEEGYNPRSPSSSIHTFDYDQNPDDTIVIKSPTDVHFETSTLNPGGPQGDRISASLSPSDVNGSRYQRRTSSTPSVGVDKRRSASSSRSPSPAHRADVPHSVESGTDTEPEGEQISGSGCDTLPPLPPPKDASGLSAEQVGLTQADADGSYLDIDELTGSSPVEHTSHATYIAPALPPIRFSMNTADFSELLNSVGGLPPLRSLARLTKQPTSNVPSTPPPSAALTSATTLTPSNVNTGFPRDSAPNNMDDVLQAPSIRESSPSEWDTPTDSATLQTSASLMARQSSNDLIFQRLRETLEDAKSREVQQLKIERVFMEAIVEALESRGAEYAQMKARFDGMKVCRLLHLSRRITHKCLKQRTSRQYIEGLTVAQTEYDRELKARRDAEAEVTRLRVLLSGQAARLTALSGDSRRQEVRQQISKELNDSLSGLEQNLSRLKVERDVTLAEVEELSATKR